LVDPRTSIIDERLKGIDKIVAVSSGKGGVGKSLIASTLALALARKEHEVGLFDLDFTSPTTHTILNVGEVRPKEEEGVVPPTVHGLKYVSIVYYSKGGVLPLRGADVSNALIELLSIMRWGRLDFLVIDLPPGIGDVTLDLIRLIRGIRFLIVTTPSRLAFETVRKLARLLNDLHIPIVGVVENMKMTPSNFIKKQVQELGLEYLTEIPYDKELEATIGNVARLSETVLARKVEQLASMI
jgi:ATP-binding protein involved in chromosome partitioning